MDSCWRQVMPSAQPLFQTRRAGTAVLHGVFKKCLEA